MHEDYRLLAELKHHNPKALEDAIHHYSGYVAAVVRKTMGAFGTDQDFEELISDTFVALWENRERLRDDSSLKYWLVVVARNGAIKRLGRTRLEETLEENFMSLHWESPAGLAEKRENSRLVREAIDSLGEEDKDIFLRHYYWYQTVSQISSDTGINESTIKSRLKRGREKLKKKLAKEDLGL